MTEKEFMERGFMEAYSRIFINNVYSFDKVTLLKSMRESQIRTFGWPIGIVMDNPQAPAAYEAGIKCKLLYENSFDYWTLKKNGDFYFLGSYFEDMGNKPGLIFYDSRINRITETIMRIGKLYELLGIPKKEVIEFKIRHTGLKERRLSVANTIRWLYGDRVCKAANEAETELKIELDDMTSLGTVQESVFKIMKELMENFDFFVPDKGDVYRTVEQFTRGQIV